MDSDSVPEISPREVFNRLHNGENFIHLDVREPLEIAPARLQDPMSNTPP